MTVQGKIACRICGSLEHHIGRHLESAHQGWGGLERYKADYPDAELESPAYKAAAAKAAGKVAQPAAMAAAATVVHLRPNEDRSYTEEKFHEVFGLLDTKGQPVEAALNKKKQPIAVKVFNNLPDVCKPFVPAIDNDYVFPIDRAKEVIVANHFNMPMLVHGKHGTGKTTLIEQVMARLHHPMLRVQHTIGMEESHVLGMYVVRNGATEFEPGPLPFCMKHGIVYLADEYDFALPSVLALYQPVLEGKALVIKEAPPEWRVVEPHPNFRFFATGNTNGTGDETGLYQGTQVQNAAAYSRFGIAAEVGYMPKKQEAAIVAAKAKIQIEDAERIVDFGNDIRRRFIEGEFGSTVSTRELIRAGQLGAIFGGDWARGFDLALVNRMTNRDAQATRMVMQRQFPSAA